jgi:rubrerythrin
MGNLNVTASAIISFTESLEDSSSAFYEKLAEKFVESKDIFQAFANTCKKTKMLVIRTYQETVSDVLETGFSFEGLNLEDYSVRTTLSEDTCYNEALKIAIKLEDKASKFYLDIAKQSQSLLATIPRSFTKAGEVRIKRRLELQSLLDNTNSIY